MIKACVLYPGIVEYTCSCGYVGIPKTFVSAAPVCAKCADKRGLKPEPLKPRSASTRNKSVTSRKQNLTPERERAILRYLADGPRTTREIKAHLGICRTTNATLLKQLCQQSKIVKSHAARIEAIWALPEHEDLVEERLLGKSQAVRFLRYLRDNSHVPTSRLSQFLRIPSDQVDEIGNYLFHKHRVCFVAIARERFYSLRKK